MNRPTDVLGRDLFEGARVGVAFSYSRASVGHIRVGTIEVLESVTDTYKRSPELYIKVRWEEDDKLSPRINFGAPSRWILL